MGAWWVSINGRIEEQFSYSKLEKPTDKEEIENAEKKPVGFLSLSPWFCLCFYDTLSSPILEFNISLKFLVVFH